MSNPSANRRTDIQQLIVDVNRVQGAASETLKRVAPARHEAARQRREAARLREAAEVIRAHAGSLRVEPDAGRTRASRVAPHGKKRSEAERHRDAVHEWYATTRDPRARAELMASYDGFARSLAFPYRHREPIDDLVQVARLALLHAVDRFDPALGRPFPLFARLTIVGELKRHLRDKTWAVRVPRSLQEDHLQVMRAVDDLTAEESGSPSMAQLADRCGLPVDRVVEAIDVRLSRQTVSTDGPAGGRDGESTGLDPGHHDMGYEHLENRELLDYLLRRLPHRDRRIVEMRFLEDMTQAEIAAEIGVSQMCVSRVLARTLGKLRLWARAAVA